MAERLKFAAPDIPIILGGVFASMNAEHILKDCPYADCIGVGEGEELMPDYLDNMDDPGSVEGLVWRDGDKVVSNPPRPIIQDLDQFPYPDRDSLPIYYIESLPLDVPAALSLDKFCTIQTSRGCPYGCIYCNIPSLSNGKWRHRSAEHVLGEMQNLNDLIVEVGGIGLNLGVGRQQVLVGVGQLGQIRPTGGLQVRGHPLVVGEDAGGGPQFGPHVGDGPLARAAERLGPGSEVLHDGVGAALYREDPQ